MLAIHIHIDIVRFEQFRVKAMANKTMLLNEHNESIAVVVVLQKSNKFEQEKTFRSALYLMQWCIST